MAERTLIKKPLMFVERKIKLRKNKSSKARKHERWMDPAELSGHLDPIFKPESFEHTDHPSLVLKVLDIL